ncbi:MAG: OmpA family protein [Ferruginibacter sp.]
MKKLILFASAIILTAVSIAQSDYKKRPSLAVQFSFFDFKSAADVRANSLTTVINNKQFFKFKRMDPALSVSYLRGFTNHIDVAATLSGGFLKHPVSEALQNPDGNDHLFLEAAFTANFKLLTDKYIFNPFLTLGVGASEYRSTFSAFTPIGIGAQIKIFDGTFILLNSQYRIPVTEASAYHFFHSIGVASAISKKKVIPVVLPPAPPVVLDRDGDGIFDADDRCPDAAGSVALQGCPDRDGDGIADIDDKCPDVAGIAKYQGCPIPDTDGDGINDEMDKCPTVKGYARYQGCPIPDTDGDGVNDEEDKCPTRPGPVSNQGCPVIAKEVIDKINFAAKNVFFSTGSFKLLPKSFASLDAVVGLMKSDESLMIDIDGHTDSQGSDESNQVLSDNRAGAVKNYLVSKGIDATRLKSAGYGETKPVADNATAAGRAKNRRTEMTVRNY